jgi:hypothetical protein
MTDPNGAPLDNPLLQLRDILHALAAEIVAAANDEPKAAGWTAVTLDARFSNTSSMTVRKVRATVGTTLVSVDSGYRRMPILTFQLRNTNIGSPFYGVLLTVTAGGEVDVRLNYDPNCYTDPAFAAS